MIQILGLRDRNGRKTHAFYDKKWGAPSVSDLFEDPDPIIEQIPEEERYNLYFTVHDCAGVEPRDFTEQWFMPFDVDKCVEDEKEYVFQAFCDVLKVSKQKTLATWSGNGMQFFIELEDPIKSKSYFDDNRGLYKLVCDMLAKELDLRGLKGVPDPAVFSYRRLMRLPNTMNVKPHGKKQAYIVQGHSEPQGWAFEKVMAIPGVDAKGAIPLSAYKSYPKPDVEAVLSECEFLKWSKERPNELSEEQWYAMLGIIAHLPGGRSLAHEYSRGYHGYSESETSFKTEQALVSSGPRTCENIRTLSDKCLSCKHYNTGLKSPISIKGEDWISSEGEGFYRTYVTKSGEKQVPQFEDLVKYFNKKKGKTAYTLSGFYYYENAENIWKPIEDPSVKSFFYNVMNPRPRSNIVEEAFKTLQNYRTYPLDFFDRTVSMVNMKNGVLDIKTRELKPHSPDYGFRNILPYNYDPEADCPNFKKFLMEVMCNDQELANIIQEFMGYIVSGDECWLHKALIFIGVGQNGKSTLNEVILAMIGENNCSKVPLAKFNDPQYLYQLEGKLVNIADENSPDSLLNSETFKDAVGGGYINVKKLYSQPYTVRNKTKFIFNSNSMPISKDRTLGLYRRMTFIPFDRVFTEKEMDVNLRHKLSKELPGILNFALEGYEKLKQKKRFTDSAKSLDILESFKDVQNDAEEWIDASILITYSDSDFVSTKEMYKNFQEWAEAARIKYPTGELEFGYKIRNFMLSKNIAPAKHRINGKQARGYKGVQILSKEENF